MAAATEKNDTGINLEITRTFNAPRALVFDCWVNPAHFARWVGPKDFTAHSVTMDPRPGGSYRLAIRSPEGTDHWMFGTYREITPPEKLVYTFAWDRTAEGKPIHQTLITVILTDLGNNQTRMHFVHTNMLSIKDRDSHAYGWNGSFDRLEQFLAQP
jgi:uncharacterized protein YndB with AHSA1/START domain